MSSYRNISLDQVKEEFKKLLNEFNPYSIDLDPEDFHKFINGFYQAEGTMTIYFKEQKSLRVGFYFAIGQNYTPEVAKLLILLQHFLGGIGNFKFEELSTGNKHIKFVVINREDIIYKVKPYLSLLYGQKKIAFNKVDRIYQIISNPLTKSNTNLIYELIYLIYNLNPEGQEFKLPLTDKLATFNIINLDNSTKP
jgi:hypothetical protein